MSFGISKVLEFRRESRDRSTEIARQAALKAANEAHRRSLLDSAPIRDLDALVPVLTEQCRQRHALWRQAEQELADVLAELAERRRG